MGRNCPPERRASSGRWVRRSQMLDYDLIVGIVGLTKSRSEVRALYGAAYEKPYLRKRQNQNLWETMTLPQ